ncbi:MAG: FMN-binding glutamate synthase family protein [Bacteriovoracaceae bacterium]|jgi:glutamate synthase domain-containing protein 2|nr:FMN-binding glutamate synthase family protein [Bacteriovoracaceae bacterium]
MRKPFLLSIIPIILTIYLLGHYIHERYFYIYFIAIPLILLGIRDIIQKKHIILRNYPILGHFRYLLEEIRPEIQQYFIETFDNGKPFSREQRSVVYQRAKGALDTAAFGTQHDVYEIGKEWLLHSLQPSKENHEQSRVLIGGKDCKHPYSCSRFNISAMSYGSLSKNAVMALNKGASMGDFFHNTGEGGISPYHEKYNADLVWQIGTGYFGCRNKEGKFDAQMFKEKASKDNVKMIELKVSQGAKPGHGGMLPGEKVTAEVAKIRAVEIGKDVNSPPAHSSFDTPLGLIHFIKELRELSGGKPVGFKICVGKRREFYAICKAMIETKIYPDFITVDGSEGGTGAAPREFSNHIGSPLADALNFVHNSLIGCGIRDQIKIIASGKIIDGFSMIKNFALGADICNSARGMMFAVGCIQALRCNSNNCPAGVATQDPNLYKLVDVEDKSKRVARFHKETVKQTIHMIAAMGLKGIDNIHKSHILRRVDVGKSLSYEQLYPEMKPMALIEGKCEDFVNARWKRASSSTFEASLP